MKISLAINSKDPVAEWLDKLVETAYPFFDEIVIYMDGVKDPAPIYSRHIKIIGDGNRRDIKDGFNYVITQGTSEWICSFCDDDFFIEANLNELLKAMRSDGFSDDADIIHFPVMTGQGNWGYTAQFSEENIRDCNCVPHGSFFRKKIWEKLGGYKTNAGTDWNFWIRAKAADFRFKFWPKPIYFFRMGTQRSAWAQQVGEFGQNEIKRIVNAIA